MAQSTIKNFHCDDCVIILLWTCIFAMICAGAGGCVPCDAGTYSAEGDFALAKDGVEDLSYA